MTRVSPASAGGELEHDPLGPFGDQTATRSPGVNRVSSARAARSASASSPANVHRRSPVDQRDPPGARQAAARSTPPTVVAERGQGVCGPVQRVGVVMVVPSSLIPNGPGACHRAHLHAALHRAPWHPRRHPEVSADLPGGRQGLR